MTPERWQQIEALYQAALDRAPARRAAFLDRACRDDPALREEVDSLLRTYEDDPTFLETPVVEASLPSAASASEGAHAEHIGPYRLIRPLGRGGMGQVYLAVRDDKVFTRYVALKVMRRGLDTDDLLRRFRAERQMLARLDHPHIARLFDGGATASGRPYFVMEYVEGVPITVYCDRHRLSIDARLRLFRPVCAAVQYAHQNLIVHRDLKPANILVTADGTPKLLDFGIAKLLHPEEADYSVPITRTKGHVMTPEYASPEQVRGAAITTASDVYALGVVLFELLAGHPPYRLDRRVREEMERVICEERPTPPSAAVQWTRAVEHNDGSTTVITPEQVSTTRGTRAEQLQRQLRGDLDNMVLMAMRKEPARRYASAEQLAEDVRRYLAGLPVLARQDTLSYRARKFVRRHRISVAVAALGAMLLVSFSAVTLVQSARIRAQAEAVRRERDRAEQVADFLVELFEASDPNVAQGAPLTARALLARGTTRIEDDLAQQPAVQAELLGVMSRVYERLGDYAAAEQLARQSLDGARRQHGRAHPMVATALNQLGWAMHQQGKAAAADSVLQEALAMRRALLPARHPDVARTLNDLAVVRQARGDYPSADTLLQEALAIRRETLGAEDPSVAITRNNLAALKWRLGDYEAAAAQLRTVRAQLQKQYGPQHMRVAVATSNLAAVLMAQGKLAAAEPLYQEALAIRRARLGDAHPDLAQSLAHLGNLLRMQGKDAAALPLLREALTIRRTQLGDQHPLTADTEHLLGLVRVHMGDYAAAEARFRAALSIFRTAMPAGHDKTARTLAALGDLYVRMKQPARAEPLLREALTAHRARLGDTHPQTAKTMGQLGRCLTALGRYSEAESLLTQSHAALQAAYGDRRITRQAQAALDELYAAWGMRDRGKTAQ